MKGALIARSRDQAYFELTKSMTGRHKARRRRAEAHGK